jgi:hypothetical protein
MNCTKCQFDCTIQVWLALEEAIELSGRNQSSFRPRYSRNLRPCGVIEIASGTNRILPIIIPPIISRTVVNPDSSIRRSKILLNAGQRSYTPSGSGTFGSKDGHPP